MKMSSGCIGTGVPLGTYRGFSGCGNPERLARLGSVWAKRRPNSCADRALGSLSVLSWRALR